MGLGCGRLAAVALLVAPCGAWAQAPADACALMGRATTRYLRQCALRLSVDLGIL
jgi:hypothetical protein